MKVTIIRHGKVKHIWKKSCSSAEYDEECRLYGIAPIEEMTGVVPDDDTKIYISTLDRSFQTAKMMYGDRDFCKTELINEVPMKSAFDTKLKLPTWIWNVAARIQWMFNSKRQPEIRKKTVERAKRFAQDIVDKNEDCVLITHGFFMLIFIPCMKHHGFKVSSTKTHYRNGESVILTL